MKAWAYQTFIAPEGQLYNQEYCHLSQADILFVWSSACFKSSGQRVVGTAQMGKQSGSKGKRELLESVYRGWNKGVLPDFIITLCVPFVAAADPISLCALTEHELHHCGQAMDEDGDPKFTEDGDPVFTMRGHDVEEFVGVVRRYGAHSPALIEMAKALKAGPEIPWQTTHAVCGCGAQVARRA